MASLKICTSKGYPNFFHTRSYVKPRNLSERQFPHALDNWPGCDGMFGKQPSSLTMKRRLDPAGKTEPRISLWRFTYSLIKSTSSSWGRKLAFKPEPINRSHNSHSHSFSTPPSVMGCEGIVPTINKGRQGFMLAHQRPASAHAPASPCDLLIYGSAEGS